MTFHMSHPLAPLLDHLSHAFASEGRPGGHEATLALADLAPLTLPPHHCDLPEAADVERLVAASEHRALAPLMRQLDWHYSGLSDNRIPPHIAKHMLTCEMIGPTGMIYHPTVRIGLFYQAANLNYVTRVHAAEETFVIMAGTALWSVNNGTAVPKSPGTLVHHPSMAPHRSITTHEGTLAAWRWTGAIEYSDYELIG